MKGHVVLNFSPVRQQITHLLQESRLLYYSETGCAILGSKPGLQSQVSLHMILLFSKNILILAITKWQRHTPVRLDK